MHTELASPVAGHCRKIGSRTHVANRDPGVAAELPGTSVTGVRQGRALPFDSSLSARVGKTTSWRKGEGLLSLG